jgi:hypothetical protein
VEKKDDEGGTIQYPTIFLLYYIYFFKVMEEGSSEASLTLNVKFAGDLLRAEKGSRK